MAISALSQAGDQDAQVYASGVDSIEFDPDRIMYRMVDSLGFDSVFVYSIDAESARYVLQFTDLGPNQGNYVLEASLANGRVYAWVAPVDGIPQGHAEPVVALRPPSSRPILQSTPWDCCTAPGRRRHR